jgi:hypothetical protein
MTVAFLLAGMSALTAAQASAAGLPKLLVNDKCGPNHCASQVGIFKVRPQKIELSEAAGGEVTISSWSSWTSSSAVGTGVAVSSGMGNTTTLQVTLTASDVKHGRFTRLTIVAAGVSTPEHLHLQLGGVPAWIT